jgi:phosphoribosylglycinamide formyltransferase-1
VKPTVRSRIAVLASGGGSNLQAILDYLDHRGQSRSADVAVVASDRPTSGALARAHGRGVATEKVRGPSCPDGHDLSTILTEHRCDLVVLAGYLRLVPPEIVRAFDGRILNTHPALLPAFGGRGMYGLRVHKAVIASGARVSGATIHLIDEEYDRGFILAQWPVPVFAGDDAPMLASRVLRVEHLLLPRVIDAVAAGRIVPRQRVGFAAPSGPDTFTLDERTDDALGQDMDDALGL